MTLTKLAAVRITLFSSSCIHEGKQTTQWSMYVTSQWVKSPYLLLNVCSSSYPKQTCDQMRSDQSCRINNLIIRWIVYIWDCTASEVRVNSTASASHRCSLMDALCTPPCPNLRTTCLFGCWSHPSVFVLNCPLTQR